MLLAELLAAPPSPCPMWGLPRWAAPFGKAPGLPPQAQSKEKSTRCRFAGASAHSGESRPAQQPRGAHGTLLGLLQMAVPDCSQHGAGPKKTFRHTLNAKCANSPAGTYRVYFCIYILLKFFAAEPDLPSLITSHTRCTTAVNKHGDELLCVNTADKLQSLPLSYTSSNHFCGFT